MALTLAEAHISHPGRSRHGSQQGRAPVSDDVCMCGRAIAYDKERYLIRTRALDDTLRPLFRASDWRILQTIDLKG
jgi:hypothetical protein